MFVTILIIIAVLAILMVIAVVNADPVGTAPKRFGPNQNYKLQPKIRMLNREGDRYEDEWFTYIAGVQHHTDKIGGFMGWVERDLANKVDSRAMGVFNSDGKLLGFIPAKEGDEYRQWCDMQPQPCMGYIYREDGYLRGRVKVLRPCSEEFMQTEFARFANWVEDNFGKSYLPKVTTLNFDIE